MTTPLAKTRLYLALYIRDGISPSYTGLDRYHWALLTLPSPTSPASSQATRFHARDYYSSPGETHWIYEEIHVSALGTPKLLAQVYIGEVVDEEKFLEIVRDVQVKQEEGWNCVGWVESAVWGLREGKVLEGEEGRWEAVKSRALESADWEVGRRRVAVRSLL